MRYSRKYDRYSKMFNLALVVVFLWDQFCWAGTGELVTIPNTNTSYSGSMTPGALSSSQSSVQSLVESKNTIETFSQTQNVLTRSVAVLPGTKTYYSNGRLQSILLSTVDAEGNGYYHFLDENWNGQGYGRIDRSYRAVSAPDGARSHTYIYSPDNTGRLRIQVAYSDATWKVTLYNTRYYNDVNNRKELRTYVGTKVDPVTGNYYFHYINDVSNNVDYSARRTALNGELAFRYFYYKDLSTGLSGRLQTKQAFSNTTLTRLCATYTYYDNSANRLNSKTFVEPDAQGNIYYHYLDENWSGKGYGRYDKIKRKSALNGELSYTYAYYTGTSGRLQTKKAYSDDNYTALAATYIYNNDARNRLRSLVDMVSERIYYNDAAGRIESKTLMEADANGNFYYHYLNENWNGRGYGRNDKIVFSQVDQSGIKAVSLSYHTGTAMVKLRTKYASASVSGSAAPVLSDVISEEEYDSVAAYPDGSGKLVKETYPSTGAYRTFEYHPGTVIVKVIGFMLPDGSIFTKEEYDTNGKLLCTKEYYSDGHVRSIKNTDGTSSYYAADGSLVETIVVSGDIETVFDPAGRIIRIQQGDYIEERKYVIVGSSVLYTVAVNKGVIKNVKEGIYAGTGLISKTVDGDYTSPGMTVTYDSNVTVSYVDNAIRSLSVENGFMNFYSPDGITKSQTSAKGDLYSFSNNYLTRIATVNGNIYNFARTSSGGETVVALDNAIIGGVSYILSSPEIKNVINGDIPNILFKYDAAGKIKEITTSEFTEIWFAPDGLVSKTVTPAGKTVSYGFHKDANNNVIGLIMSESGATREFDAKGNLLSIQFKDGTDLQFENGVLESMSSISGRLENISFDGSGNMNCARMIAPDGSQHLFAGGNFSDFIDSGDIEYRFDAAGHVSSFKVKSNGEIFSASYLSDPSDGKETIKYTSETSASEYVFKEDLLRSLTDASGLKVEYEYSSGTTSRVSVSYGGQIRCVYTYGTWDGGIKVTDSANNVRYYNANNDIIRIDTPYNETYCFEHYIDSSSGTDKKRIAMNYTYKTFDNGSHAEYFKGKLEKLTYADGLVVRNIEFDNVSGKLRKFYLTDTGGKNHSIEIYNNYVMYVLGDESRIIFKDGVLVAFSGPNGVIPVITGDITDLINFLGEPSSQDMQTGKDEETGFAGAYWRNQDHTSSLGITEVDHDYETAAWDVAVSLDSARAGMTNGEMYLDMRYDIPGYNFQSPLNLSEADEKISFYFRIDDKFLQNTPYNSTIQVFVKDNKWRSQYGSKVVITRENIDRWVEVFLKPTASAQGQGYTDAGFDPTNVVMLGIRVSLPENAPQGTHLTAAGNIELRENILPEVLNNFNYSGTGADNVYYQKGITHSVTTPNDSSSFSDDEKTLRYYFDTFANGPKYESQKNWLDTLNFTADMSFANIKSIVTVQNDYTTESMLVSVDFDGKNTAKREGEMKLDLRGIYPPSGYNGDLNLTMRKLSMLVELPEGLINDENAPTGVRLFVRDVNGRTQYGTWTNVKEADKWYKVDIMPTTGVMPMSYTQTGFDPYHIVSMGLSVCLNSNDTSTVYNGTIRAKFLPETSIETIDNALEMPIWMDLRDVKDDVRVSDNVINVPSLNYIKPQYFNYVFNRGSGAVPTVNYAALEAVSTAWQKNGSISSVGWNSDLLKANFNINGSMGEVFLDTRYNCYVPGMNWQNGQTVDMSRQKIVFSVRPSSNFTANTVNPLKVMVFAKSEMSGVWSNEYSQMVDLKMNGEWTEISMIPSPSAVFQGSTVLPSFDPTKVGIFGLKLQALGGTNSYAGTLDISYKIIDMGAPGVLTDPGTCLAKPVWVDQRELAKYLKTNGITVLAEAGTKSLVDFVRNTIAGYLLGGDFNAFTVYDENNKIVSITKPDQTTTYFNASGNIDHVRYENGEIFVDYAYDGNGDLLKVDLVSMRNKINRSVQDAANKLEKECLDALLVIDAQLKVIQEDVYEKISAGRAEFSRVRSQLEGQLNVEVTHDFLGWEWSEEVENPAVREALDTLARQEADFNAAMSSEIARLNSAFSQKRSEYLISKELVLNEYEWQKDKFTATAAHEEVIPVVNCYMWELLGREVGEEELKNIFADMDETNDFAGFFSEDLVDPGAVLSYIKTHPSVPFAGFLSDNLKSFMSTYISGAEVPDDIKNELILALDKITNSVDNPATAAKEDFLSEMTQYYGSGSALRNVSSGLTKSYLDEFEASGVDGFISTDKAAVESAFSSVEFEIANYKAKKDELLYLLNNPSALQGYSGYWSGFLAQHPANDLAKYQGEKYLSQGIVVRDNELYERHIGGLGCVYLTKLTGYLAPLVITRTVLGKEYTFTVPGDLADTAISLTEVNAVKFGILDGLEARVDRGKTAREWVQRSILQDLLGGAIRPKNKNAPDFTVETFRNVLTSLEEYNTNRAFKETVINKVRDFLTRYMNEPASRGSMLVELGLTVNDVIALTPKFMNSFDEWLTEQDSHFGRSAFASLKKFMDSRGAESALLEDVSKEAILIDVLIGNNGPLVGDSFEISMYAMECTAKLHGLSTKSVRMDYTAALSLARPFVTLINSHHYVTVLSMTSLEVTYWDANYGAGGGEVKISRAEFEEDWQGNIITDGAVEADKILSVSKTKEVRGAFVGLILAAIGFIVGSVTAVAAVASAAVLAIISTVGTLIAGVVAGIMNTIGVIGGLFVFTGNAFLGATGALGAMFKGIVTGTALSGMFTSAVPTVVGIGTGYFANSALNALGVDPMVSGIISSVITGGVMGFLNGGIGAVFSEALKWGAYSSMSLLGSYFDLDPAITGIMSMATSALVGGFTSGMSFSEVLGKIAPNVVGELAYYGVTYAAEAAGLPNYVSQIAGMSLRSSLVAGFSDGCDPGKLFNAALSGATQGITSIGLSYATQELGLNPLLANIGFSAISTAINGTLKALVNGEQNFDIFKYMFETYRDNTISFIGSASRDDLWAQAVYISRIQDFSSIVRERGIVNALNTYAIGFFNSTAVNAMITSAGSIGQYIKNKLDSGQYTNVTLKDNVQAKKVDITGSDQSALLDDDNNFKGLYDPYNLIYGDLAVDNAGKLGLFNGFISGEYVPGLGIYMNISKGSQSYAEVRDSLTGEILAYVTPNTEGGYNYYNTFGEYVDAKVKNCVEFEEYSVDWKQQIEHRYKFSFAEDTDCSWLSTVGLSADDLDNFTVIEKTDSSGKNIYDLEWVAAKPDYSEPSSFLEALIYGEAKERILNGFQGFGFVKNSDIQHDFETKVLLLNNVPKTGMVISIKGRGLFSNIVKISPGGGVWNHTAMIYVDDNGNKWVFDMEGPTPDKGLRVKSLDEWLEPYRQSVCEISIGGLVDDGTIAIDLKAIIERDLFVWEKDPATGEMVRTNKVIDLSYDMLNLIGVDGPGEICSSLIVEIYRRAGHPLFGIFDTDEQLQYSPSEIYRRLKLLGYVD